MLIQHPKLYDRMHAEILEKLGKSKRPNFDDLWEMKYIGFGARYSTGTHFSVSPFELTRSFKSSRNLAIVPFGMRYSRNPISWRSNLKDSEITPDMASTSLRLPSLRSSFLMTGEQAVRAQMVCLHAYFQVFPGYVRLKTLFQINLSTKKIKSTWSQTLSTWDFFHCRGTIESLIPGLINLRNHSKTQDQDRTTCEDHPDSSWRNATEAVES